MDGLIWFEGRCPERSRQFVAPIDDPVEQNKDLNWFWADYSTKHLVPTAKKRLIKKEGTRLLPESDELSTSDLEHIFSLKAVEKLRDLFEANGKLFEIEVVDGANVFAFAPQPIEAIDVALYHEPLMVGSVMKYWPIKAGMHDRVDIFQNTVDYRAVGYSSRFVAAWRAAGLKGWEFKQRTGLD